MASISGILFDVDETLFDRDLAQRLVLDVFMSRFSDLFRGIADEHLLVAFVESDRISNAEYEAGLPMSEVRKRRFEIFLELIDADKAYADQIAALYVREYPELNAPIAGARELISQLAGRFKLGIISNGFPDVQYRKLAAIGMSAEFECVVLSEELGISKPDPEIFRHALSLMGMSPEEAFYIGDSFGHDVVGAIGVGMQVIWYNPHGSTPARTDIEATYEVTELAAVLSLLPAEYR